MNLPEKQLGYQTSLFTFLPLPRTNVGQSFSRESNGVKVTYTNPFGVPYRPMDRRILELMTTKAVKSKSRRVEFGPVSRELVQRGLAKTGAYLGPAIKAFQRIGSLAVYPEAVAEIRGLNFLLVKPFVMADEYAVLWGKGRTDLAQPELIDRLTYLTFSEGAWHFIESAAPHIQDDYMKIQSPFTQDVYPWVISKLWYLSKQDKDEELVKWAAIYAQFGQTGGRLKETQMKDIRRSTKASVLDIVTNYYKSARIRITDQGIIFRKSPPLIDPESKKAGFSIA